MKPRLRLPSNKTDGTQDGFQRKRRIASAVRRFPFGASGISCTLAERPWDREAPHSHSVRSGSSAHPGFACALAEHRTGVPTRLRRVARRRAGPARPAVASIAIRIMITIRTLVVSTKLSRQCKFRHPDLGRVPRVFPGNGLGTFSSDCRRRGSGVSSPVPTRPFDRLRASDDASPIRMARHSPRGLHGCGVRQSLAANGQPVVAGLVLCHESMP